MLLTSIPYKFQHVWGQLAGATFINNTIPDTATGGHASQQLGFPPITATPTAAGGIPPDIADFNGAFNYFSKWLQWMQAGAPIIYDSTFQAAIGGYVNGAIVRSAVALGVYWMSTVDNNLTDPDAGGAGWVSFPLHGQIFFVTNGTFVAANYVKRVFVEVWGGGGGSTGGNASSGAGGGYTSGWVTVNPGTGYPVTVGAGGVGSPTTGLATLGGTSSFQGLVATGGAAGWAGAGFGGTGSGGSVSLGGQHGTDLTDGGSYSLGMCGNAVGGNAPKGGFGGNVNSGGASFIPTVPGGGGGANSASQFYFQDGATGMVVITY